MVKNKLSLNDVGEVSEPHLHDFHIQEVSFMDGLSLTLSYYGETVVRIHFPAAVSPEFYASGLLNGNIISSVKCLVAKSIRVDPTLSDALKFSLLIGKRNEEDAVFIFYCSYGDMFGVALSSDDYALITYHS